MRAIHTIFTTIPVLIATPALAAVIEITPADDFEASTEALTPGDTLIVHGGDYTFSGRLSLTQAGTEILPVIIRAAEGESPHISRDASQNVINVEGASFLTIQGLEITGGADGIKIADADHLTISGCTIHDVGGVGINFKPGTSHHALVEFNEIYNTSGTAEGMYIGCNDGTCIVHSSSFIYNWVHDCAGTQGDGIELKQGSWGNIIAHNVVHDTQYPCIIVYGTNGEAFNIVEGNLVFNGADSGIQAEAEAVVRNNIIIDCNTGLNSHDHQNPAGSVDLSFLHNTVIGSADRCASLANWSGRANMVLANNALYCPSSTAINFGSGSDGVTIEGNVVLGTVNGASTGFAIATSIGDDFTDYPSLDVWPTDTSALLAAAVDAHATAVDFNGTTRTSPHTTGAYHHQPGGNPGWILTEGFKGDVAAPPDATTDASTDPTADPPPADSPADMPTDTTTTDPGVDSLTDPGTDPEADPVDMPTSTTSCTCALVA